MFILLRLNGDIVKDEDGGSRRGGCVYRNQMAIEELNDTKTIHIYVSYNDTGEHTDRILDITNMHVTIFTHKTNALRIY